MSANRSTKTVADASDNTDPSPGEPKNVAAARALFEKMLRTARAGCGGKPLHEIERAIWGQALELARVLLACFVESTQGAAPKAVRFGDQDVPLHCWKRTTYFSAFGKMEIVRPYYWSEQSKGGVHPLDHELNLPARCYSYFLQEIAALFAVRGAYERVTETLEKLFGVTLWKQGAELIVGDAGEAVQAYYERRRPPPLSTEGPILAVSVDGKGVPMRKEQKVEKTLRRTSGHKRNKKQMSLVSAVYTADPRGRTPAAVTASLFSETDVERKIDPARPKNKHVRAWLGPAMDTFDELERYLADRSPHLKKELVLLIDGEKRLVEKAALKLFDGWTKILDVVHAVQRIWDVGVALLGEGKAREWVRDHVLRLLSGEVEQLIAEFESVASTSKGARRKAFTTVARYFRVNRERMRYDEYLKRGLPIGTGVVEGACCTLVKQRMEGPGMRWSEDGAQAVLELRAVDQNKDWEAFWRWFPCSERDRLYGRPRKNAA